MMTDKHLFSESIYVGHKALAALLDAITTLYEAQYEDEDGNPVPASHHLADMLIHLASTNELRFKLVIQTSADVFEEYVLNEQTFRDHQANVLDHKLDELIGKLDGLVSLHATTVRKSGHATQSFEGGTCE